MKKLFILFALMFTSPLLASGIGANVTSAPCDNATLETYGGTANVEINWEPNTINLRWYDRGEQLSVQSAAQTCTYDGTLNIPENQPTRTGYTFVGWELATMDFGTIPTNKTGLERWSKDVYNGANNCIYGDHNSSSVSVVSCESDNNFNELQTHEWKVRYDHGELYGVAGCSADVTTKYQPGNPNIGSGQYCWCKATGYKFVNTNLINVSLNRLSFIYVYDYGNDTVCQRYCAFRCSRSSEQTGSLNALFAPVQ